MVHRRLRDLIPGHHDVCFANDDDDDDDDDDAQLPHYMHYALNTLDLRHASSLHASESVREWVLEYFTLNDDDKIRAIDDATRCGTGMTRSLERRRNVCEICLRNILRACLQSMF